MHTHLNREDRTIIANGLSLRESYQRIGERIGRDKSVVSREVKRNSDPNGHYHAGRAHKRAQERRRTAQAGARKIENSSYLVRAIEKKLEPLVSPEVLAQDLPVCTTSIYAFIYRSRPDLKRNLPNKGRRRRKKGQKGPKINGWTTKVKSIGERPTEGEHWEGDTICGTDKARMLTHVHTESLFFDVCKLHDGYSCSVQAVMKSRTRLHGAVITYDRGSEFSEWKRMEGETRSDMYFAHPGCPWERGKNENSNGRLRRVFPKKTKLSTITQEEIDEVVWTMNHTKRKTLNWRTPCEVYGKCCNST